MEETVDRIFKEGANQRGARGSQGRKQNSAHDILFLFFARAADKDNNGKIDEHEFMVWSKKSDVLLSFWQNLRSLGARVKQSKFRKTPGP